MNDSDAVDLAGLLRPGERHHGNRQKPCEETPPLHLAPPEMGSAYIKGAH